MSIVQLKTSSPEGYLLCGLVRTAPFGMLEEYAGPLPGRPHGRLPSVLFQLAVSREAAFETSESTSSEVVMFLAGANLGVPVAGFCYGVGKLLLAVGFNPLDSGIRALLEKINAADMLPCAVEFGVTDPEENAKSKKVNLAMFTLPESPFDMALRDTAGMKGPGNEGWLKLAPEITVRAALEFQASTPAFKELEITPFIGVPTGKWHELHHLCGMLPRAETKYPH